MNSFLSLLCKIFLAPIVKILLIKEVKGRENIPERNFILASNHQSHMDEIATSYVCVPRNYHFIGQTDKFKGLKKALILSFYFITGVIPLDRKSDESKRKVIKEAIRVLKKGDILIIYPEGTRTRTGKMGEAKPGVARIFLETKVPIVPLAVKGTFELMPPGKKPDLKRILRINIGQALYFEKELEKAEKLSQDSKEYLLLTQEIADKVMKEISSLYEEIRN